MDPFLTPAPQDYPAQEFPYQRELGNTEIEQHKRQEVGSQHTQHQQVVSYHFIAV